MQEIKKYLSKKDRMVEINEFTQNQNKSDALLIDLNQSPKIPDGQIKVKNFLDERNCPFWRSKWSLNYNTSFDPNWQNFEGNKFVDCISLLLSLKKNTWNYLITYSQVSTFQSLANYKLFFCGSNWKSIFR